MTARFLLCPDRFSDASELAGLPRLCPVVPRQPFQALTFSRLQPLLAAAPAGCVVDLRRAGPWDDPVVRAALALAAPDQCWLLPRRFGAEVGGEVLPAGHAEDERGERALEAAIDRAVGARHALRDEDGPLLRRRVLEARQTGSDELPVRLLRLAQHELAYGAARRARDLLAEAVAAARAETDPGTPAAATALAGLLDALGDTEAALDDRRAAAAAWSEAERVAGAAGWGRAVSQLRLGQAARDAGRFDEAAGRLDEAVALAEREQGRRPMAEEDLAHTLLRAADAQVVQGDLEAASRRLGRAQAHLRGLCGRSPRRFDLRAALLAADVAAAGVALSMDDVPAARVALAEAASAAVARLAREPWRHDFLRAAGVAMVAHADLHFACGRPERARRPVEAADRVAALLLERDPQRVDVRLERLALRRRLAWALLGSGSADAAERVLVADRPAMAELSAAGEDPERAHALAAMDTGLAVAAEAVGDRALARERWAAARAACPQSAPAYRRTWERCHDALVRLGGGRDLPG